MPCDADRVGALIDRDAFRARLAESDPDHAEAAVALIEGAGGASVIATKLCAWMSRVESYKFLRLRPVDGHLRIVMRRSPGLSATYHELELTRSDDGQVRVADLYSYFKGEWISDEIADATLGASNDPRDIATALKLRKVASLEGDRPAEALALLDELPPKMHGSRWIQTWRVKVAQNISADAYKDAAAELSRRFPDDPSVALIQIDGAYLRGDIGGALHNIDLVDAAVGPDPFLDGTRAMMLAARNGPGDLDLAEAKAENAVRGEPQLPVGVMGRVAVALARHQWGAALEQMDALSRFGLRLSDAAIRTGPMFKELVQTPEYAAWRAQHP